MPDASLDKLRQCLTEVSYPKGFRVLESGKVEKNIFFIKEGIVRAYTSVDGKEITFWVGKEGATLVSMKGYVNDEPGYETMELMEDSVLYVLKRKKLKELFSEDLHIANWGRRYAEMELLATEERLISMLSAIASERYKELLEKEPDLLQRLPLGSIATYLGITQASLSRIRAQIKIPLFLRGDITVFRMDENSLSNVPDAVFTESLLLTSSSLNSMESLVPVWLDEMQISDNQTNADMENNKIRLTVEGGRTFTATLVDNTSAQALVEQLAKGDITVDMEDYADMEKVGTLGISLPRNDRQTTTGPGDLILYQGHNFVIYYDTNSWNFTRLGKIDNVSQTELKAALGEGDVRVTLSLEH